VILFPLTADKASEWARWLWSALMVVWLVLWASMKRAKKLETPWEMLQHALPVILGFWLLFGHLENWGWLDYRPLPNGPRTWLTGLALTLTGVGLSVWARLTLGANWSGVVTLKKDHELVRRGLYRSIRHPIYTGILVAMFGTALIKGHLRGWFGFAVILGTFYFKARREERFLRQEFGPGFEEHMRTTGMFLPKWTST
jgi:protein-S-isoprenylcysteine O-methyltransferase Ste14